jgi:hypothetical protein
MRRLAARAGAYAPGIQEHLFYQVSRRPLGVSLDSVEGWMRGRGGILSELGYYVLARRTAAPTEDLFDWIQEGKGYRAAVLGVDGSRLYNGVANKSEGDAVGLALYDATSGIADEDRPKDMKDAALVMIDPWPGVPRFLAPPRSLDIAHGSQKYATLLLFWTGYG